MEWFHCGPGLLHQFLRWDSGKNKYGHAGFVGSASCVTGLAVYLLSEGVWGTGKVYICVDKGMAVGKQSAGCSVTEGG